MIKKQINVVILTTDFEANLLADKRETCPQLEQELPDVGYETSLNLPLLGLSRRCEKLEVVGILQQLACEVRLGQGEGTLEVRARFALPIVEIALDPMDQDVSAPAVIDGFLDVPLTL